jgi:hypothetical protein
MRHYKIVLRGTLKEVPFREDEVDKLMLAYSKRQAVVLKRGLVETKYIITIVPDVEAYRAEMQAKKLGNYREENDEELMGLKDDVIKRLMS